MKKYITGALAAAVVAVPAALSGSDWMPEAKPQRITVVSTGAMPSRGTGKTAEEDVQNILKHWQEEFARMLASQPDLMVVPEVCDSPGYVNNTPPQIEYYKARGHEPEKNRVRALFAKTAAENNCYVVYSGMQWINGKIYNTLELFDRKGKSVGVYLKNYITVYEDDWGRSFGTEAPVWETDFGTVAPAICFDLNFTELLERYAAKRPKLILFASAYHGGLMQGVWAYFCRSYFVGAFGRGSNDILNPLGSNVAHSTNYFPRVTASINLDYEVVHLDENWGKLDAVKKKYGKKVTIFDPGHVGAVLLTSEMKDVSAADIVREFKIERWDEYYKRSVDRRNMRLFPGGK
ncbi:MAG: carbon-nitrogen hydrolase family protein [Lentisphaeria bacterium]|nr:carbon-nitrogen hydrolase family protein [Lentisphaeria bacterium]